MATIVNDLISYLQAGEAIADNDAVYISNADGKIYKFDVTDDTKVFAGIAKEAGVLNDFIRVAQSGRVKGFSGLTAGAFVYASVTTPGGFQLVEPASSQKIILGIAKSATELVINGGLGIKPGGAGGGGGLDVYYTEDMESLAGVGDFSTGNNAAFMGVGTLQGTLALEEVSPISGTKSLSYIQAAGSLNDYFASEVIELDNKQQNNDSGMTFYFQYDGNANDGKFVVYDVTNSAELTSGVELIEPSTKSQRYALSFYVPATCTQIRWGYQVLVENIGAELVVDDVEITSNPFVYKDLIDPRTVVRAAGNAGQSLTANVTDIPFTEVEDDLGLWDGDSFTAPEDGDYIVTGSIYLDSSETNTSVLVCIDGVNGIQIGRNVGADTVNPFAGQVHLDKDQVLTIRVNETANLSNNDLLHHIHIQKIPESTEHVITPAKNNTNTFSARIANNGTATIISQGGVNASGQNAIASVNRSALGIVDITWTSGFFTEIPSVIGSIEAPNRAIEISSITTTGVTIECNRTTDAAALDNNFNLVITRQEGDIQDATLLAAIPTPKTAYIKDVKPSGTAGGTFTAGAWQTRDLNTLEGDDGFVSLSGNQFTLQPGKYEIEASAPSFGANRNKCKIRNITDSLDTIIGTSERSQSSAANLIATSSVIKGSLIITSSKTFELQHQGQSTQSTTGFGVASSFGVDEIYTQVKITRIG